MAQERRKSPRSPAGNGSRGRIRSTVEVEIVDLSTDGLRLEVATSLRPGAVYDLKADLSGYRFSAEIRITRCSAGGYRDDGRGGRLLLFKAGAEFLWNGADQKVTLARFLEEAKDGPPRLSDSGVLRILR